MASEFPNDNPALHDGVIWVCLALTGPAVAELVPPRAVVAPHEDEIVIEELTPLGDVVEVAGIVPVFDSVPPPPDAPPDTIESAPPPASEDPFTMLVCTLADVAIGAGAPHVASLLPGLLFDGRVPDALDEASETSLRAGGVLAGDDVDPAFVATTNAWRAILRGQSDDFSACTSMLDEWTSGLLARLLGAEAPRVRQELRSRGVAAFGLSV